MKIGKVLSSLGEILARVEVNPRLVVVEVDTDDDVVNYVVKRLKKLQDERDELEGEFILMGYEKKRLKEVRKDIERLERKLGI